MQTVCCRSLEPSIGNYAKKVKLVREIPDEDSIGAPGALRMAWEAETENSYGAEWPTQLPVSRPISRAKRTTSLRVRSPSLSRKRERYVSTVFTLTAICSAISWLL